MKKTLQKKPETDAKAASHVQEKSFRELAIAAGGVVSAIDAASSRPMLCDKNPVSLTKPGFFYELKLDGVRILADKRGSSNEDVALYYRSGIITTKNYPEVTEAIAALPIEHVILDGEIIAFDEQGRPSFEKLQSRIMRAAKIQKGERTPAVLVAFDVLSMDGVDVTRVPLATRRQLLERVVPESGVVSRFPIVTSDGRALYELCKSRGMEGLVAKDPKSAYFFGERSTSWSKIRIDRAADFVVVGYAKGEKIRHGIKAITLATYEDGKLKGRGDVGSGMSDDELKMFAKIFATSVVDVPHAIDVTEGKDRVFVRPEIVVRVRFLGVTEVASLRQPVFVGVRPDIAPEDCQLDE